MSHPLEHKIVALRRRVRRMAMVYGWSIMVAILLGAIIILGSIDFLLRFQDRGLRIMVWLMLLGIFGWTFYRYMIPSLGMRISDADLALRVQRHFSSLGDRLVSAVDFLHVPEDDPTAGSPALRRAVVAQTTNEIERLDFSAVLDPRPTIRAAMLLLAMCLAGGILVILNPPVSRVALARLVNPFGNTVWPQATHLALRQPVDRIARGQAFQIEVVDARGASLPPEVSIHYRFVGPDGVAVEETDRLRKTEGAMIARREKVSRPFSFRIEGGDDRSMPWHDVQMVESPTVESLSIRLIPPAYTGWPPTASERPIRALIGTKSQISGKSSVPLQSAVLCISENIRLPTRLSDDGRDFAIEFTIEKSGSYSFELTDREGLSGGSDDRWEIHAMDDVTPTVNIEIPAANLFVTPSAVVPLRVVAQDDLALHRIAIKYLPSPGQSLAVSQDIYRRQELPGQDKRTHPEEEGTDRRVANYRWELAPLRLQPGMQVTFHATAEDDRPQSGESSPRSLTVITAEELQDRIIAREKIIAAELNRAMEMQRGCRAQVESMMARLANSPHPRPLSGHRPKVGRERGDLPIGQAEVDRLQAVAHNQRDVDQILSDRGEGVPAHIAALLADLENNRISSDDIRRRMLLLSVEIDRLGREQLPMIGRELTAALKMAQVELEEQGRGAMWDSRPRLSESSNTAKGGCATAGVLAAAAKRQDAVIDALAALIGQLARSDDYRRFVREIGRFLREQEDVARRTTEVGRRTLTQDLRDLPPNDVSDLSAVAGRQIELARQIDRFLQEMDQTNQRLREHDPAAAQTVANALEQARRLAISGQMSVTGHHIDRNRIGRAAAGQKQIDRDLHAVLAMLTAPSKSSDAAQSTPDASQVPDEAVQPKSDQTADQSPGNKPAADAAPQSADEGRPIKPVADAMHDTIGRLWGELPERARQHMLKIPSEEFSPKYETMIEEYYRRLAEENGNDKR